MRIRNGKKRGEWAELVFALRAIEHQLTFSKPWGESSGYDFAMVVGTGRLARVQVKSTMFREGNGYSCSVRNSKGAYKGDEFDYLAAYVIPEDAWYIIPSEKVKRQGSVTLSPQRRDAKYETYREAWNLLGGRVRARATSMEACAAEWPPRFTAEQMAMIAEAFGE